MIDGSIWNKLVEGISYEKIAEFINKLNEQNNVYEYQLLSVEQYLAVLGNAQTKESPSP